MPLSSFELSVREAIMFLGIPTEFEISEYLEDSSSAEVMSNNSRVNVKKAITKLLTEKKISKCKVDSKRYSIRYDIGNRRTRMIEPGILSYFDTNKIIPTAKQVVQNGEKKYFAHGIYLLPDKNRDVVVAVKKNHILGVIDFRAYHEPADDIRFPSRFYQQRIGSTVHQGMTELQYFSRLFSGEQGFSQNRWLNVIGWG